MLSLLPLLPLLLPLPPLPLPPLPLPLPLLPAAAAAAAAAAATEQRRSANRDLLPALRPVIASRSPRVDRTSLLVSGRSAFDFLARVLFFALAPFGIVRATALFPVWGALASVFVALLVFVAAETVRGWAASSWLVRRALARELALEEYYRARPPRPFLYYVFYPFLFPYWLVNREARREFWLFKGYTIVSVVILLASVGAQYSLFYPPELGLRQFLPIVAMTLAIEALLVLGLLLPIATTVIEFHARGRRGRLFALLGLMMASTAVATWQLAKRRDPIVSFATRERVRLRTAAQRKRAHDVQLDAVRTAITQLAFEKEAIEGDGKVEGSPLEQAHAVLERFYKHDEAFAFDLWASPRQKPKVMVLYFEARPGRAPIWVAVQKGGTEITDPKKLPSGAFMAMKHAADE